MRLKIQNFRPGHSVHPIQARKALEDHASWEIVSLLYVGRGKIAVRSEPDVARWFKCGDFIRFLRAVQLEPGLVSEERRLMLASRWSVLVVPPHGGRLTAGSNEVAPVPAFKMESGAVIGVLTTLPWQKLPMFSVCPADEVKGIELPPPQAQSNAAADAISKPDDKGDVWERLEVNGEGELVAYRSWNGGFPGGSGSTEIFEYEGLYYVQHDGMHLGPFVSKKEAVEKFNVFAPTDEYEDDVTEEIWDSERGLIFQRATSNTVGEASDQQAPTLWVVGGQFVTEPYLGGQQLGELPEYDVSGHRIVHITQEEYDAMMEEYRDEHGHYPDT